MDQTGTPIFLTAEWRHLAMLNYEIDPAVLAPFVPAGTELGAWNEKVYVSLVGFMFLNTRVRGFRVPFHQHFEELNLRFYVRRRAEAGLGVFGGRIGSHGVFRNPYLLNTDGGCLNASELPQSWWGASLRARRRGEPEHVC